MYTRSGFSSMVDMGNGHFGMLSGRSEPGEEETINIHFHAKEKNVLLLRKNRFEGRLNRRVRGRKCYIIIAKARGRVNDSEYCSRIVCRS